MSEASSLTNDIIDYFHKTGAYAWRASSTGIYDRSKGGYRTAPKKGVTDILAIYKSRFIAVEIKIGKDRLSEEQQGFMKNIEYHGGAVFVARSFESFKEWWSAFLSTV